MSIPKKTIKFITSRTLYLILGIFLAAGFAAYATWDDARTGGSGELTEANWNEIVTMIENEIGNIGVFGNWTSKSASTVYQASTDGMVVCESPTSNTFAGYTDGNNPPTTVRTRNAYGSIGSGITMPVKKGDYWKVTASGGSYNIYWIPLGL